MNTENKPAENAQQTIEDAVKQEASLNENDFNEALRQSIADVLANFGYSAADSCVMFQVIPRKEGELNIKKPFQSAAEYGVFTGGTIYDPMTMGYCLARTGSEVDQFMKMLAYAHSAVDQTDFLVAQVNIIRDIQSIAPDFNPITEGIAEFVESCFDEEKTTINDHMQKQPVTKATNSGQIYDFDSNNISMGGVVHPLNDDEATKGASISEPVAFDPLKDGSITGEQVTEEHSQDMPQCPPPTSENGL